jgi:hypothetical protein
VVNESLYCRVHSLADELHQIEGDALFFKLVQKNGEYFLKCENNSKRTYEEIIETFRMMCIGLSVATIGHFWIEDELYNEKMQRVWSRERKIRLVPDKEIDLKGKHILKANNLLNAQDLLGWISLNYPRVFLYYTTGLFLLRSSFTNVYLYPDILLNFFKIIELVTYKRTNKKPNLRLIKTEAKNLNITVINDEEIRDFYIVRSQDAAHDYDNVKPINRQQAVECKMWADEFIIRDFVQRKPKPKIKLEIKESQSGTIVSKAKE